MKWKQQCFNMFLKTATQNIKELLNVIFGHKMYAFENLFR